MELLLLRKYSDVVVSEFHGRIEINVRFLDITEVEIFKKIILNTAF